MRRGCFRNSRERVQQAATRKERLEIGTIAVIGAGTLGRSFATAALAAGYRIILEDVLPERLAAAETEVREWLEQRAASGRPGDEPKELALARFSSARSVDLACREADLVLETLPDEMELKIDVFCILEKFARPGAILATSAASLSVTEIAAVTTRGEYCVGLRLDPAAGTDLLEIVRGRETSEQTVGACHELGRRMGKQVVVVPDVSAASR